MITYSRCQRKFKYSRRISEEEGAVLEEVFYELSFLLHGFKKSSNLPKLLKCDLNALLYLVVHSSF